MTSARSPASGDADRDGDLAAWLLAVHHEVGNHLAAVRFAAQLAGDDAGTLGATAEALDRAAMHAGSLLALTRPLLLIDTPEHETLRVEALFDSVARELAAQGQPAPQRKIETGLPTLRVCRDALQPAITAIGLRGEPGAPARLYAGLDQSEILVRLETRVEPGSSESERTLILRLAERLMRRCEIPFAAREGDLLTAEFRIEAAT